MSDDNRWSGRSRDDDRGRSYGPSDRDYGRGGGPRGPERSGESGAGQRAWSPFGEDGPSNYDRGRPEGNSWFRSGEQPQFRDERGAYRGYGRGPDRDQDGGFGETGSRYSDSFQRDRPPQDYRGPRDQGGTEGHGRSWLDKAGDQVQSWLGDTSSGGGEHRGRGPKGYRRSDERIRDEVSDRLSDDSWLDASDIEVKVENAEVTLSGTVARREDKRRAEDLADHVSGVQHVQNNLRLRRQEDLGSGFGTAASRFDAGDASASNPAVDDITSGDR